jgi:hypothetical protein
MSREPKSSIRNLAKACGFHYSTVSLALRNSSKVNAETRRTIIDAARKFGYKLDPSASLLMSTVRQQRGLLSGFPVGMISFHDPAMPHARKMHRALGKYAERNQIPFNLFNLSQDDLTQSQVARIADSRGLKGLIFGGSSEQSKIEWPVWKAQKFAYLVHSQRAEDLLVDHVTWDVFAIVETAVRELEKAGCRNFAVFLQDFIDVGAGWHWSASCELIRRKFRNEGKPDQKIRVFYKPDTSFRKWVEGNQPVGLIRIGTYVYRDSNLSRLFPGEQVGYSIEYPHSPDPDEFSIGWIEPDYDQIAETSFDTLCVNMFFNRTGVPSNPKRIYLDPVFTPKTK